MKIIVDSSGEYRDVINSYYDLKRFDDGSKEEVLFQGYATSRSERLKRKYENYRKRGYLNLEAPCSFTSTQTSVEEQAYFTHVYSICPYTCDWLNNRTITKFIPIPFPYSKRFLLKSEVEKKHDVMYMGTLMNNDHFRIVDVMRRFDYVHTSISPLRGEYRPTHTNTGIKNKLDLLSKSRVSVAMNLAPITRKHIASIRGYDGWRDNIAFSDLESSYIPQFKPRVIESMIAKTLVLVKNDFWNVIEHWFEPDKHFVYWYGVNDLENKIRDIVNNYDDYQNIINQAYEKVREYEIDRIYENIICSG